MRRYLWPTIIIFVSLAWFANPRAASAASGRASWSYNEGEVTSPGSGTITSSHFSQRYHLSLSHKFTDTIGLNFSNSWTYGESKSSSGSDTRDGSYSPQVSFSFNPPALYDVSFGYGRYDSLPSEGDHITSTTTHAAFSIGRKKWPSLSLSVRRSETWDNESPRRIDNVGDWFVVGTGYSFNLRKSPVNLNYGFSYSTGEDRIGDTVSERIAHNLGASHARTFLNRKGNLSFSYNWNRGESTIESIGSPQRFEYTLSLSNGYVEENPASNTVVTLLNETELVDGDVATAVNPPTASATIDFNAAAANWNVGLDLPIADAVHKIHVYVTTTVAEEANITGVPYNFNWELYTSTDNITWTLQPLTSTSYDALNNRFVINFPEYTFQYFKVVNTTAGGGVANIDVTEVEALGYLTRVPQYSTSTTSESSNYSLSLGYNPNSKSAYNYNVNVGESTSSSGNKGTSMAQGVGMRYAYHPKYLIFSSGFSLNQSWSKGTKVSESNNISMGLRSRPLDTMSLGLSLGRSESGLRETTTSDNIQINTSLLIYPGINGSLRTSRSLTKKSSTADESEFTTYSMGLGLEPWQKVSVTLSGSYSTSESTQGGATTSSDMSSMSTSFSYRPKRMFSFSASFTIEPLQSQTYRLSWVPTSNISTSYTYGQTESSNSFIASASWRFSRRLNTSFSYSRSEHETSSTVSDRIAVNASLQL